MSMIQIVTAKDEINASIIKGFLESCGIQASYGPNASWGKSSRGPSQSQTIYVDNSRSEEALKLLKEQKLID